MSASYLSRHGYAATMGLAAELVEESARLRLARKDWDSLAVELGRPYCAPAWMLAWWEHARPRRALLRTVLVRDGEELVAVAPFYADRRFARAVHYRLLAADVSHRVVPLIRPGVEDAAIEAIVHTLAAARPRPAVIHFESVEADDEWPARFTAHWPGPAPPLAVIEWRGPAPTVRLGDRAFDDWLRSKSRNFRSQAGRMRRRLEAGGARFCLATTAQEAQQAMDAMVRLHYARWEGRGGSTALDPGVERMLAQAASELLADYRFRLFTIEAQGATISAHLFMAAGGAVSYWNGGFDDAFAGGQPSMQVLLEAIADGMRRSDRCLDLGGGREQYKLRLADAEDVLETSLVVPRGDGYALTRAQLMPRRVRQRVAVRLPNGLRRRLRAPRTRRR